LNKYHSDILVISPFVEDVSTSRPMNLYNYFKLRNYDVNVLYCKFSHSLKKNRIITKQNFIPVNSSKYSRNISISRFFSHFIFSLNVIKLIIKFKPKVLVINFPPNILILPSLISKIFYKSKIVIDIIDFWPESFPIKNALIKKVFNISAGFVLKFYRFIGFESANLILTQSNVFINTNLNKYKNKTKLIGLTKYNSIDIEVANTAKVMTFCYIGNIGNIYDFDSLIIILSHLSKSQEINLDIIGLGENLDYLIEKLKQHKINYKYHGVIYDEIAKSKIISTAWFGYNGYKESTNVSISYKFVDYVSYFIPVLNSASGDTWNVVEVDQLGINFSRNQIDKVILELGSITYDDIIKMKLSVQNYYLHNYSLQSMYDQLDKCNFQSLY
jgi:hypothetical protein